MPTKTPSKKRERSRTRKPAVKNEEVRPVKESLEELETLEFIQAVDRYKRKRQKAFPSWSEILGILKSLGYRKVKD